VENVTVKVIAARCGDPTLRAVLGGQQVMIHSRYDPRREASRQVEASGIVPGCRVVVCGAGLGYVLESLSAVRGKTGNISVLVLEPVAAFHHLLEQRPGDLRILGAGENDLPSWITVCRGSVDELMSRARQFLAHTSPSLVRVITNPGYQRVAPACMDRLTAGIYQRILYEGMNLMTGFLQGMRGFWNVARNADAVAGQPGVKELFDLCRGVPAAVVSVGPSLDHNAPVLKKLRDRMLIVAVDGALKPLLGWGIKPHLVVAADENPGNVRKFTDLGPLDDVSLAAVPSVDHGVFENFQGPVFLAHNSFPAGLWLKMMGVRLGTVSGWGSVATSAFDLCTRMGADPIVFFGQDCSYSRWKIYGRGQGVEELWSADLSRYHTLEKKNLDTVLASGFQWERDLNGRQIPSAMKMAAYRDYLAGMIRDSGRNVINASEEGILFGPGVVTMEAASLVDRFQPLGRDLAAMVQERHRQGAAVGREQLETGLNSCAREIETLLEALEQSGSISRSSLQNVVNNPLVDLMMGPTVRLLLEGPLASGEPSENHLAFLRKGLEEGRDVTRQALAQLEGGSPCIPAT